MTARQQRMLIVILVLIGVGIATTFGLRAFQENLLYYYSPSAVQAGEAPVGRKFRVGGLVVPGTVKRTDGEIDVSFDLTDNAAMVTVEFAGILPDLFREGQGIIAHGKLNQQGVFVAEEVLAKHDENYMPPEVAESLKQTHAGGPSK
ncbi:MAG: cytochrome c maturation protein CcmE [Gammaproteobacteria bacterium]|jgi:cytochrome c-type biogenesis protein CcmE|nr:cytochrome c maturation protein CcmE [Gammaproteobacteria bacterium]